MIYDLSNEYTASDFIARVKSLLESKAVVELKRHSPQRTIKQNSYLHLILGYFATQTGMSLEDVKYQIFKVETNRDIFVTEKEINGKTFITTRHSNELSTSEMATAITRFRNWSSAVAGIYLPEPNETSYLAYIEAEIERNKEYLW